MDGRSKGWCSIENGFGCPKRTFEIVNKRSRTCKHARVRGSDGPASPAAGPARTFGPLTKSLLSVAMCTLLTTVSTPSSRAAEARLNPAGPPVSADQPTSTTTLTPPAGPIAAPAPKTGVAGPANPSTPTTTPPAGPPLPGGTGPRSNGTWTLAFGGDTLLTRRVGPTTDPFGGIRPPLADADLAIVNLETAVSTRGRAQVKTFTFRSAPSFADVISRAGVDVVSLANNHSLDFGLDALDDTIDNLDRVLVAHVGAGRNLAEALAPAEFDIGGTTVAVLAASQIIPNGAWPATATRPGIASAGKHAINRETQQLLAAVRGARAVNEVVVVVLHWGIEGDPCPSAVQQKLGRLLVDAGATAVLGAHPHILQPVVPVSTTAGDAVVAYSLGNFIWDPRGGATGETGVLELRFDGPKLAAIRFAPHRLDGNGWARAVDRSSAKGRAISGGVARKCPGAPGVSSWDAAR